MSTPSEPLAILFAIESLSVGGAERLVVDLARGLAPERFRVQVACLRTAGPLAAELGGVPLHVLDKRPGIDPRLPGRLRALVERLRPAIVNSHLWTANTWTRASLAPGRFPGLSVIATEHNRDLWKRPHHRAIDRWLAGRCRRVVAVSADVADFYVRKVGLPAELVQVIENGIALERVSDGEGWRVRAELGIPDEAFVLGTAGRMVAQKNHLRLLEAAALVRRELPRLHVLLVGAGPLEASLRARALKPDLAGCVRFAGLRADMADVFAAMDLFALSSDREGHPLTLMEAQAAGVAVVATDVGGTAAALARSGEETGGILVEPATAALAAAVLELARAPCRRRRMAACGRAHALEHFGRGRMLRRYEQLFWEVAHAR